MVTIIVYRVLKIVMLSKFKNPGKTLRSEKVICQKTKFLQIQKFCNWSKYKCWLLAGDILGDEYPPAVASTQSLKKFIEDTRLIIVYARRNLKVFSSILVAVQIYLA